MKLLASCMIALEACVQQDNITPLIGTMASGISMPKGGWKTNGPRARTGISLTQKGAWGKQMTCSGMGALLLKLLVELEALILHSGAIHWGRREEVGRSSSAHAIQSSSSMCVSNQQPFSILVGMSHEASVRTPRECFTRCCTPLAPIGIALHRHSPCLDI